MSTSPTVNTFDRPSSPPHLVSLVLQSKKGLQHGEQLCSYAHDLTHRSARQAVDVLALDAKIRWIKEGVLNQLKVAAGVAKCITERRDRLEEEAKARLSLQWDRVRSQHQDALDVTLESLGSQVVPPSFHQSSLESSLFGIQASESNDEVIMDHEQINDLEVTDENQESSQDRRKWKTLRDFVDERGLEDLFESIEGERSALDDILGATATHPATITSITNQIRSLLSTSLSDVSALLVKQERTSGGMASHLESLAAHYDQMATALKEKEAGEDIGEEDMEGIFFVRDTAELPSIVSELEESIGSIETVYQDIMDVKNELQSSLATQSQILDSLDSLGHKMESMLQEQTEIETETQATYDTLNDYLESLLSLRSTYDTYQMSYNALVMEMDRRIRYRNDMELLVQEMREKLGRLRDDEMTARDGFYSAHSASIPDDLCLAISNIPQTFVISYDVPKEHGIEHQSGDGREVLPEIDDDLVIEVVITHALALHILKYRL
ncbi:autophagy-related protein 17 [Gautieria morchelliformis]|nr:autophagy-related protein 17 [Gautieria morchelliformis]